MVANSRPAGRFRNAQQTHRHRTGPGAVSGRRSATRRARAVVSEFACATECSGSRPVSTPVAQDPGFAFVTSTFVTSTRTEALTRSAPMPAGRPGRPHPMTTTSGPPIPGPMDGLLVTRCLLATGEPMFSRLSPNVNTQSQFWRSTLSGVSADAESAARPSKIALRRTRIRKDLATAAIRIMSEKGFEATTIEDIARAADYHRSSFFRYFASKEEAVFFGIPELTETFRRECAAIRCQDGDRWSLVRDALIRTVSNWTDQGDPELFSRQFLLWNQDPGLQAPLASNLVTWSRIITDTFAPENRGTPADLYAHLVGGALMSTLRAAVESGGSPPRRFADRLEEACRMLEDGLSRHP